MTEHATHRALREEADAHVQEIAALRIDLDAARAEIQRLRAALGSFGMEWRPIESAPFGKRVLLGWRDWRDHAWCLEVGSAAWEWRQGDVSNLTQHGSATHWAPLPPPPDVVEKTCHKEGGCDCAALMHNSLCPHGCEHYR